MFNLDNLSSYKENNRLEAKKAVGGLPKSIWETYSSFANTNGGIILLGVEELSDGSLNPVELPNPEKLVTEFWNIINDRMKVNVNILSDKHVTIEELDGNRIIVINVPRANRTDKPVYIDNNPIAGSYRRNWQGDYHCTKEEVSNMFRDQTQVSQDTRVLEQLDLDAFDYDTVRRYRNRWKSNHPGHAWENLEDTDFLQKLGCIGRDENGVLRPTAAGILMFGFDYEIEKEYSYYFLDYQEHDNEELRWTDRIYTSLGDWSGNVYDFYCRVSPRVEQLAKKPYIHDGEARIDDTPVHKALREALTNALLHANYYDRRGLVIHRRPEKLVIENPGCLRLSVDDAVSGGFSDPRNMTLVKMFNLINIGDRAGTGLSTIYSVWEDEGWIKPALEEQFNPDRTVLALYLSAQIDKKMPIKSVDKKSAHDNERTLSELLSGLLSPNDYKKVLPLIEHLETNKSITPKEAESLVNKSSATARRYLGILTNAKVLVPEGKANNTIYIRVI
ncbi:MAG: putative DNA binding domain-containing protein [Oscillospiraceae bacterium]|nr:putative DNA binding domain-containing protein [Oscillospiraceae bacterium]